MMSTNEEDQINVTTFKTRYESMSVNNITNMSMRNNSTDYLTSVGMVLNNGEGCMK